MSQTPPPPQSDQPEQPYGSDPGQQGARPADQQGFSSPPPQAGTPQGGYAQGSYGQQPPPNYQQAYGQQPLEGDEKTMMMLAHLSGPIAMLLSAGWVPFLGPLLIWLFYKDKSRAVRTAAAGAFNFNLSVTIASVVTWISVIITLGIGIIWAIPIWIVLFIVQLWCHIKGAVKASNGEVYDYPFQIRLLS